MAIHGNRRSHLGSARITLDNAARVIESRSYTAFGDELTSSGTGARTSYIGRETDNESDLGFYGVRLYDPTYGRFLSTDPLWSKYLPLQSYQYAGNSPVMMLDDGGKEIEWANEEPGMAQKAQQYYGLAIAYFKAAGADEAVELLENARDSKDFTVRLSINDIGQDRYREKHGVDWDPNSGLEVDGSIQSPALGLVHEMAHAVRGELGRKEKTGDQAGPVLISLYKDIRTADPVYSNAEEARVILGIEFLTAMATGEKPRFSHTSGKKVKVAEPVVGTCVEQTSQEVVK